MRRTSVAVLAIIAVVGAFSIAFALSKHSRASQAAQSFQARAKFALTACPDQEYGPDALCGTYDVWEDRALQRGRKIGLNIVVLPARTASPSPDPLFWLEGGPGAPATSAARPDGEELLPAIRDHRDLIFVDQRGTGGSNPLLCDFNDNPDDGLPAFFGELFPLDKVRSCREKLEKIANLKLYTTPIAMDDLDDVRAALGYDKINLAGASYGTFAAQIYLRRHPDHVRAAFLAGVATPNIKQPLLFPGAAQLALNEAFKDCQADTSCHKNFPDIQKEFAALLARFDNGPLNVEFLDPRTKTKVQVRLPRGNFVEDLRLHLYTTFSARLVPYIIHRAYQGDFLPFESMAIGGGPGGLARGMYMTVTCSEGVPFITPDDLERGTRGTFVGSYRVRVHMDACKEWPRGDIPQNYTDLVKSDLPVLMISGEADGATPPSYAEAALKNFSHGRQVRIPHYGHQTNGRCLAGIFKAFLEKGAVDGLDTGCVAETHRPPFATALPSELAIR